MSSRGIEVVTHARTAASPEVAFDTIIPIDLAAFFTGFGPIPAVVGVQDQTGDWDAAGQTRRVNLKDGSYALEEINSCIRPERFEYTLSGFTGFNRHLVTHADGCFTFEPDSEGTRVGWSYMWHPRNRAVRPLVWVFAKLWQRYSQRLMTKFAAAATRRSS